MHKVSFTVLQCFDEPKKIFEGSPAELKKRKGKNLDEVFRELIVPSQKKTKSSPTKSKTKSKNLDKVLRKSSK